MFFIPYDEKKVIVNKNDRRRCHSAMLKYKMMFIFYGHVDFEIEHCGDIVFFRLSSWPYRENCRINV